MKVNNRKHWRKRQTLAQAAHYCGTSKGKLKGLLAENELHGNITRSKAVVYHVDELQQFKNTGRLIRAKCMVIAAKNLRVYDFNNACYTKAIQRDQMNQEIY